MLRTALGPAIAQWLEDPKVIQVMLNPDGRIFACIVGRFGKLKCAEDFRPDHLGVIQVLKARRVLGKLVVAEIARAHPSGDNQKVEWDLASAEPRAAGIDRPRIQVNSGHFRQHHGQVTLLDGELPDRRRDLQGCKHPGCRLIEERLKYVVIAPVDKDDLGIGALESARRGDPGEATSNDHDTLLRSRLFRVRRVCVSRLCQLSLAAEHPLGPSGVHEDHGQQHERADQQEGSRFAHALDQW